jgi:hypothetical protein
VGWERGVAAGIFQEGSVEMDEKKLVEHAVIKLANAIKDALRGLLTA